MNQSMVFAVSGTPSVMRPYEFVRHAEIGHRIHQQLERQRRQVAVARHQRHYRSEIAARQIAADRDAVPVDPERTDCAITQRVASAQSSTAAGNLCSGAMR